MKRTISTKHPAITEKEREKAKEFIYVTLRPIIKTITNTAFEGTLLEEKVLTYLVSYGDTYLEPLKGSRTFGFIHYHLFCPFWINI